MIKLILINFVGVVICFKEVLILVNLEKCHDSGDSCKLCDSGNFEEYGESSDSRVPCHVMSIYQIGVLLLKNFHFSLSFFQKRSKNPILHDSRYFTQT